VLCEIDQYHDAPLQGWPGWISGQILDKERYILVASSPGYARRWSLAEQRGVGLGAKFEGKLIRQRLYAEEGLNGRVLRLYFVWKISRTSSAFSRGDTLPNPALNLPGTCAPAG
jgi:hypothetical protein